MSRALLVEPDQRTFEASEKTSEPHLIFRELLRPQIGINTRMWTSVAEFRQAYRGTRRIFIEAAEQYMNAA